MKYLFSDLVSGVRMLVKYPMLSTVAIATLGIGIALSTTVFCVVNGGILKGLPFPNAHRIVALMGTNIAQRQPQLPLSVHDFAVYQARQSSFEYLGAYVATPMNLSVEEGRPERFSGAQLTVPAFKALGVQAQIGRGFQDGDDLPGSPPIVLLGDDLWRDRYASNPSIVGTTIRANGVQRVVIGVMPAHFRFPIAQSLWTPLVIDPVGTVRGAGARYVAVGLLKAGVSVRDAQVQAGTIASQLETEFPATHS